MGERAAPAELGDRRGNLPPGGIELYSGAGGIDVVGESHRRDTIQRIVGGSHREGVHLTVWAQVVPQRDNPHDKNAIAVLIDGKHVGYLPKAEARRYRKVLEEYFLAGRGAYARCDIRGGWDRGWTDKGDYSLRVYMDEPKRQAELLANGGVKGGRSAKAQP